MSLKKSGVAISLCLCTFFLFGFLGLDKAKGNPNKAVIATVGKEAITKEDFINRVKAFPDQYDAIMQNDINKDKILSQMIDEYVIYNYARDKGYEKNDEYKKQLELAKKQLLIATLLKNEIEKKVTVSDNDARDFYAKNKAMFEATEERKLSHILVTKEAEAQEILKELKNGVAFKGLAEKKSIDPTGKKGGELGWFVKNGQLVPEFEKAAFTIKNKGDTSEIVKTQYGYHIIKLDDTNMRKKVDYSEAKERIQQALLMQKQEEALKNILTSVRTKYKITKDVSKLK